MPVGMLRSSWPYEGDADMVTRSTTATTEITSGGAIDRSQTWRHLRSMSGVNVTLIFMDLGRRLLFGPTCNNESLPRKKKQSLYTYFFCFKSSKLFGGSQFNIKKYFRNLN
jgi:hypothetical protein